MRSFVSNDRDVKVKDDDGNVAYNVFGNFDTGLLKGVSYDEIQVSYPTNRTETFTYKLDNVTTAIITVVYVDATKDAIQNVSRSQNV